MVELSNESDQDRTCHYSLGSPEGIVRQLRTAEVDLSQTSQGFLVWHTHPSGLIGPSPTDMEWKVEGMEYLVVTVTEDGPVPARF